MKLTQTKKRVSVEITIDDAPSSDILNETIIKRDLSMLVDEDEKMKITEVFNPNNDYNVNVQKFINSRPSIHYITYPELFVEGAEDDLYEMEKEKNESNIKDKSVTI